MTPTMYSNAIEALVLNATVQLQQSNISEKLDSKTIGVFIFFAVITAAISFAGWLIRRQMVRNDKNSEARFSNLTKEMSEMKTEVSGVKDNLTAVRLEIANDYVTTKRFEDHEKKNDTSLTRIHERIDGIQGAPKRHDGD